MTIFCHFCTLNNHKKSYKPILLAQEVSADPQGPRTTKNKIYFLRGPSHCAWGKMNFKYRTCAITGSSVLVAALE